MIALLLGPSSICSGITLLISYRKSMVSELIIPVEALVSLLACFVIFDTGLFSDSDSLKVFVSASNTIVASTVLSLLFLTAAWNVGFLLRNSIYLPTWIYFH